MLADHPRVSREIFHPRTDRAKPTLVVDVPGARLGCFVRRTAPDAGFLLHFHGNGELASEYDAGYAGLFLRTGVNVCFAEYRGYGSSTGEPAAAAMLADGEQILRALGVPPERVIAFGRSLGSVYAIELARRCPTLAGLVIESGIADVGEVWSARLTDAAADMGVRHPELLTALRTTFDHQAVLMSYRGPLLVLHAEQDRLVPWSHGERLHRWAAGADKKLIVLPNGNHNTILPANMAEYLKEVESFLGWYGTSRDGPRKDMV